MKNKFAYVFIIFYHSMCHSFDRNFCPNAETITQDLCFQIVGVDNDWNGAFKSLNPCVKDNLCKFKKFSCYIWDDPGAVLNCLDSIKDKLSNTNLLLRLSAHGSWNSADGTGSSSYNSNMDNLSNNTILQKLAQYTNHAKQVGVVFDSCSQGELQAEFLKFDTDIRKKLCMITSSPFRQFAWGNATLDEIEKDKDKGAIKNLDDLGRIIALDHGGTYSGFPFNETGLAQYLALKKNDQEFLGNLYCSYGGVNAHSNLERNYNHILEYIFSQNGISLCSAEMDLVALVDSISKDSKAYSCREIAYTIALKSKDDKAINATKIIAGESRNVWTLGRTMTCRERLDILRLNFNFLQDKDLSDDKINQKFENCTKFDLDLEKLRTFTPTEVRECLENLSMQKIKFDILYQKFFKATSNVDANFEKLNLICEEFHDNAIYLSEKLDVINNHYSAIITENQKEDNKNCFKFSDLLHILEFDRKIVDGKDVQGSAYDFWIAFNRYFIEYYNRSGQFDTESQVNKQACLNFEI